MVLALQPVVVGLVWLALIVLAPSALFWLALLVPKLIGELRDRRAARLRALQPAGQPFEKLVADLRRLRAELVDRRPPNNVRLTALVEAYDDVLAAVCNRLEIATELAGMPLGRDRDVERLRAESAVEAAGVALAGSRRRPAP